MSKKLNLAATVAAAAAVFVSAPYASAATGRERPKPVVTDVKTVAPFDWSAGEVPENITVNPDSTLTVSMLGSYAVKRSELVRVSANGQHKTVLLADVSGPEAPPGAALLIGAALATGARIAAFQARPTYTHASGREPNWRNLMIQYSVHAHLDSMEAVRAWLAT